MTVDAPLLFECPRCQAKVSARQADAGSRIVCPQCQKPIKVPGTKPVATGGGDWWDEATPPPRQPETPPPRSPEPRPVAAPTADAADDEWRLEPELPSPLPPAAPVVAPEPPASPPTHQPARRQHSGRQFGFECKVCGTRMYATLEEVGTETKCPDCHTPVTVRAPSRPPTDDAPLPPEDGEFRLSEIIENKSPREYVMDERVWHALRDSDQPRELPSAPARPVASPKRSAPTPIDIAHEELLKARIEADKEESERPVLPVRPFRERVLDFFRDAACIFRWLTLTGMLTLELYAIAGVQSLGASGAVGQFAAMILTVVSLVLGLVLIVFTAINGTSIISETALGHDVIEDWPNWRLLERMHDALLTIVPLVIGIVPGFVIASLLSCGGAPGFLTGVLMTLSTFATFPVLLLSILHEGTPTGVYSQRILTSLQRHPKLWKSFYWHSGETVVAGLIGWLLTRVGFLPLTFIGCGIIVAAVLVYFRLVGRLAWCRGDADEYIVGE